MIGQWKSPEFTPETAKAYILSLFDEYGYSELRSYWHEVTHDGVFHRGHVDLFNDTELLNVADDLHYQIHVEISYLL